jgi:hypothetical protein
LNALLPITKNQYLNYFNKMLTTQKIDRYTELYEFFKKYLANIFDQSPEAVKNDVRDFFVNCGRKLADAF